MILERFKHPLVYLFRRFSSVYHHKSLSLCNFQIFLADRTEEFLLEFLDKSIVPMCSP